MGLIVPITLRPPVRQAFLEEVIELDVTGRPPLGDEVLNQPADEIELPRLEVAAWSGLGVGRIVHPFLLDRIRPI